MTQGIHWRVVAVTAFVVIAAGACATTAGLLVNPLHLEFGWSHATISAAASLNLVFYGLTGPFAAAAMDRFGTRRVVITALALIACGAGLTTTMGTPWQFALGWGVLVGAGTGMLSMTFAAAVAGRWFVARRGLVTGILTAASVFGQFALLPVFSRLVVDIQWRAATGALVAVALAVIPVAWLVLHDRPTDVGLAPYGSSAIESSAEPGSITDAGRLLLDALRRPVFWLLAGTFAVCGATTNGIMWTHFTPAAHDHGMPTNVAASLLAGIGLVNVAGTIGSGWLTDRLRPHFLLAAYYALRGLSLVALPSLMGPTVHPAMLAFVVVFGLLDVATVPPTIALCRHIWAADGPIAFGWISATHQLGAGLLTYLGGSLRDLTGTYTPLWFTAAALCGAAAALALLIGPHRPNAAVRAGDGARGLGADESGEPTGLHR